jgi:succinate dehydrogenase/fumarate reductase flavoprotein subunit
VSSLASIAEWADEADVVILGFGLAGAVTAIEAHDADPAADILIVEKMPAEFAGGNSRASGQGLFFPHDVDRLMTYQQALNQPNPIPEDVLRAWAEGMVALEPWVERMAAEVGMRLVRDPTPVGTHPVPEFPDMPGCDVVEYTSTIAPGPSGVWRAFKAQADRRPIRTRFDTRAIDLVHDPDTLEVFGVVVEEAGQRFAIRARRAVVMATGGFENNLQMQRDYFGLERVVTWGTPGNTGDGIKILQKAGAELWHLRNRNQTGGFWPAFDFPGLPAPMPRTPTMTAGGWIDVAKDNRRFYSETEKWGINTHYKQQLHGHWVDLPHAFVLPVHMIFDEAFRPRYCLTVRSMSWGAVVLDLPWSADNSAEIAKGWIVQAGSIGELAEKIGRDPAALEATVNRFNDAARTGHDPEFGRAPESMTPIDTPPFYAVEIVPAIVCTTGGGVRDARSQVVATTGQPIPRLYEAGELGSTFANLYQYGSFLTECMVFGRIAGRNAVAEPPAG